MLFKKTTLKKLSLEELKIIFQSLSDLNNKRIRRSRKNENVLNRISDVIQDKEWKETQENL